MGFWGTFLGHAAVSAINDTKKHDDLCKQLTDYELDFNKYLQVINCATTYLADWGCIDTGSISVEKNRIDTARRKIEQYIELGGNPQCIHDLDIIDDYIAKVKFLISYKCLYRQDEFQYDNLFQTKEKIEIQERYLHKGIKNLLYAKGNILKEVLFENYENENNGKVETTKLVQVLTPELTDRFLKEDDVDYDIDLLSVNISFETDRMIMYDWAKGFPIYYIYDYERKIDMSVNYTPFCDGSVCIVDFIGLKLMMLLEDAELLKSKQESTMIEMDTINSDVNTLSGIEFENVCKYLIEKMEFKVETTKASGDGGIDLVAYNEQPILSGKYIIQCKRYSGSVGEPIIRDLYGVVTSERANKGILMTTGYFTKSAIEFAEGKPIELMDGMAMNKLFVKYGLIKL